MKNRHINPNPNSTPITLSVWGTTLEEIREKHMESTCQAPVEANESQSPPPAYVSTVDPFLVEALQNPRHRLTILRMELDIQTFLQNPNLQQFEFPHFPTSYLRLAAHRVAQHYGLQTMVQDIVDGQSIRILVLNKPESKFPAVRLTDVPAKVSENDKLDQIKVVIRPRPKASSSDAGGLGPQRNQVRSVEERKEDYDRARARIFRSPSNSESDDTIDRAALNGMDFNVDDGEFLRNFGMDGDKSVYRETGYSSKVAILRDREKDRTDPDYDRSYDRYVKNFPSAESYNVVPFNMQNFRPPFVQYDQNPGDALYMQWPSQSMMYAQSYDQLRHAAVFQAPLSQQPLSFDYYQNQYR
ncbi:hypothetical protein CASFOL_025574 [Castilleja foliolosa]|uniref:Uncharacterized protein n=1 Tax=Castilleja foliolosa TaxID=1961234 RepID=A0ABD3CVA2_9LAMI